MSELIDSKESTTHYPLDLRDLRLTLQEDRKLLNPQHEVEGIDWQTALLKNDAGDFKQSLLEAVPIYTESRQSQQAAASSFSRLEAEQVLTARRDALTKRSEALHERLKDLEWNIAIDYHPGLLRRVPALHTSLVKALTPVNMSAWHAAGRQITREDASSVLQKFRQSQESHDVARQCAAKSVAGLVGEAVVEHLYRTVAEEPRDMDSKDAKGYQPRRRDG
ncbi:hypothetical protein LTR08_002384 [Meristemomyces frigidus]|nr:hypothetical protein LTR08_002384 [Meristemomyces frigidus]